MNLVIDVGNSRTKLAVFQKNKLIEFLVSDNQSQQKSLKQLFKKFPIKHALLAKVSEISEELLEFIKNNTKLLVLSNETPVPFTNLYATPKTLGLDRIALAVGAVQKYPSKNVLVIDAGTCITFDFVSKQKEYLGGAISLGIKMRYKALQKFTAKLPLLQIDKPTSFIGNSTEQSIHSGVVNGVVQEINGVISQYEKKFGHLTIVLTGGDTKFLSKQLKSSIFANQNFLLEGLNEILIFNDNND